MRQAPKGDDERTRRNTPVFSTDSAVWDGKRRGPTLPIHPQGHIWCDQTKKWWLKWRTSPQSMLMVETDWEQMITTALIHDRLWSGREISHTAFTNLAGELRRREDAVGASYEARKSLHLNVESDADKMANELDDPVAAVAVVDYAKNLGLAE